MTFSPAPDRLPEAPISAAAVVLGAAVDIAPSNPLTEADVVFTFDQSTVPSSAASPGKPLPTIENAGIEVFNEAIGTWIAIPSTIDREHNQVRAHAPHFSDYRLAIGKIGSVLINGAKRGVTVVYDATMSLVDHFRQAIFGLFTDIYRDLTGTFDDSKYRCDTQDPAYQVDIADATRQHKIAACVKKADGNTSQVLIKNGLAAPLVFHSTVTGISPEFSSETDVVAMARNFAGLLLGNAYVSGLETTSFSISPKAPDTVNIDGSVSWVAVAIDMALAAVTVILPESKATTTEYRTTLIEVQKRLMVELRRGTLRITAERSTTILQEVIRETKVSSTAAGQATLVLDTLNCVAAGTNATVTAHDWVAATEAITTIIKNCLSTAAKAVSFTDVKVMLDALGSIASTVKTIPEIGQLAAMRILALFGQDATTVRFTIRRGEPWSARSLTLTSHGLGAVKIGMTAAQAQRAAGVVTAGPNGAGCLMYGTGTNPNDVGQPSWRTDQAGHVELILTGGPLYGRSPSQSIHTPEGIGLGDPLEKVLAAYKRHADRRIDIYDTTVVTVDSGDGTALRFDFSDGLTVASMEAGRTGVIGFTETCG
ncbi:hypothetical protein ACFVYA_35215 [Amycolatopsis sp. NPDC058278]|uniref:hypothetical protein n=1 Tax=Amycolatopsis sp. NPDC058278 TaxID=3346417 RepID=UPI0036DF14F5